MDAIENFAADVAHEIKNPLTSLKSAVDVANNTNNKKQLNKGTYEVKTNEIAEKIIQKYKEQTFHKSFP